MNTTDFNICACVSVYSCIGSSKHSSLNHRHELIQPEGSSQTGERTLSHFTFSYHFLVFVRQMSKVLHFKWIHRGKLYDQRT